MKPWQNGPIRADESGHRLIHENGTPFFYLADTAWDFFHRLTEDDAQLYLADRRDKGFNVIQAVIISEFFNWKPSISGEEPFIDRDIEKPNPRFFAHVRRFIELAAEYDLYILTLPLWAEFVTMRVADIPMITNTQHGYGYGKFLGELLGDLPNVLWCLGGDRLPDEKPWGIQVWRAMAHGIADGVNGFASEERKTDYSKTFMTFHCHDSSSRWFHEDKWIDMHMWGSYHSDPYDPAAYQFARKDYRLPHPKPTLNGESCYENHSLNYQEGSGRFTARDVRRHAYWSVFSGACGHTYGAYEIFPLYDPDSPFGKVGFPQNSWKLAIGYDGAYQMQLLKKLLEADYLCLEPDPWFVRGDAGCGPLHTESLIRKDKTRAYIYSPARQHISANSRRLAPGQKRYRWFSPVTGSKTPWLPYAEEQSLLQPMDQDAVLIIEIMPEKE